MSTAPIIYLMATLLGIELAVKAPHPRRWSAATGAAVGCLLTTNLTLVLLLPACVMFWWCRAGVTRFTRIVPSLTAAAAGLAGMLAVFAGMNRALGGHWLFLEPSIRFARTMSALPNPWRAADFQWHQAVWLVMPACVALGAILTLTNLSTASRSFSRAVQAAFLVAVATWVAADALTSTALLQYPYYVSYLAALALIALPLQVGEPVVPRGWRAALTIELALAAALAVVHVGFLWHGAGFWARVTTLSHAAYPFDNLTVISAVVAAVGLVSVVWLQFSVPSAIRGALAAAGLAFLCAAPHFWQQIGEPDARARFQTVGEAYRFIGTHLDGPTRFWYRLTPQDAPPLRAIASTYLWGFVLVNEDMPRLTGDQAATLRTDTRLVFLVERQTELDAARAALQRFGWDYSIVTEQRFGIGHQSCTVVIAALTRAPQTS